MELISGARPLVACYQRDARRPSKAAGAYEKVLSEAKATSMQEMIQRAQALGARSSSARLLPTGRKNAIVGIDIDYETVGANGSMLMVATSGTAVVI